MIRVVALLAAFLGACSTSPVHCPDVPQLPASSCPLGEPVLRCPGLCTAPILVRRSHYTLAYSPDTRTPVWACETVERQELKGDAVRPHRFRVDPRIPGKYQVTPDYYTRSGYDRGHLLAAANHLWDQLAADQLFYMSNVVPQRPVFNRGVWSALAAWVRTQAKTGMVWVVTGPVWIGKTGEIAAHIRVPTHYFKVLVRKRGDNYEALAFLVDHLATEHKAPYDWRSYLVSIDLLEEMTGLDFMPYLSDKQEAELERKAAVEIW